MVKKETIYVVIFLTLVLFLVNSCKKEEPVGSPSQQADIAITVGNNVPTITSITLDMADNINIIEGGNRTLKFSFVATDLDGASNLNDATASGSITKAGETTRTATCAFANTIGTNSKNYSCTINVVFYDGAGTWSLNAGIQDINAASAAGSNSITITETTAIVLDDNTFLFSTISPNQQNITSLTLIAINNTGNDDITGLETLNISAKTLVPSTGVTFIPASNFTIGTEYSGTNECNPLLTTTTRLANFSIAGGYANFTGSIKGSTLPAQATGNRELLELCLIHAPSDLVATTYSASGGSAWTFIAY